ncbi:MAG TPA: type II secretion system protein [Anaeromyxobacter sp.]
MRRARTGRGFTLIELLVVISVIALLAGLAAPAVGTLTGANAREAAGRLAGGMRYLFDTAALRHTSCRLALDLDHDAWWAECAPSATTVARTEDDADLERRFPGEKAAELRKLLAKTDFGSFSDRLVAKKTTLPGNAKFGAVRVEGRREAESGIVYVHFFPGGQAQRAYVPVADGNNLYTVVVEPFTGRAHVAIGKVEPKE